MLQQTEAKVEMVDLKEVKVSEIIPNPANPRLHFPEEELARLTESIALHGISSSSVRLQLKRSCVL